MGFGVLASDLLDLDIGGAEAARRHISDSASLHTSQSQQSALSRVGLQLPDSSSDGFGGGFMLPDIGSGSVGPRPSSLLARDEDVLLPDIDIGVDADGNFIEFDNVPLGQSVGSGVMLPSDGGAGARDGVPGHLGVKGDQVRTSL
jgi:hypothetical protein